MVYKMEQRQSEAIEIVRFLLVFLVLFIHMRPFDLALVELNFSSMGLYVVLSEMVSHNLGGIAVPCFFLFSGFFFFCKIGAEWSFDFYWGQLRKRCWTLLLPIICLAVCLGLYFLLSKACPRLLSVLMGSRNIYNINR
jgi:peptidoglycan/LPS O-acetylase OafA/YrhL